MPTLPTHDPRRTSYRVLVVDDYADGAALLAEAIGALGYQVRVALDGAQALAVAAQLEPHLVLLDLGMPDMSGFEVARRLMAMPNLPSPLHLIAVTGHSFDLYRSTAEVLGFSQYVVKPVDLPELARAIDRALIGNG